ncbi:SH3 domain-containing protein [Desertifilum sp. FACHB-1129]|uniref:SH3 domain-containing protein n=1 Tax=unclassified Desertifilum TaxID=2621682 RepID=UPI0016856827|nr:MULTISPECIES: SH3 domain-containing protein [unclassified Desertifilum]MBD2312117.1 SH3 domain-containing protein [Desertifilum sp. FACHB-1129]MBD2322222.1 SH3 domain-containing protein [Desertifilum sp. FACHB-866]MBD2332259.1 SH3 domain-containing protein [Desertifilum sp. FACHB-868]MDA0210884.1 SH3 domain-containing protein [Cyanobacteria bacterium FC1]
MSVYRQWGATLALFSTLAIASADLVQTQSAIAQQPSPPELQLAQGLVGQCRAATRDIFIYSERSTTSTRLRAIPANSQVTLADQGSGGWIAISAPTAGFVQAADLRPCTGTQPQPGANLCRQLTTALNVRANPSETARIVSTLNSGQRVTLRSAEERVVAGRSWVEITGPTAGWISSGVGTNRNITNCPGGTDGTAGRVCRVTVANGLRTYQSAGGAVTGSGIGFNEAVTITGERRTIGDRVWLQISRPVNAWISSGFVGNESNLTPNPCR